MNKIIKPSINAKGFRQAVKDYSEESVIEELAANSYDEYASTLVVLLDTNGGNIYVIDNGRGFNDESIREVTTLGGGDKVYVPFSKPGQRVYLGSYGYGLKSTLNISSKIEITSASKEKVYQVAIDWAILDEALKPSFEGYPFTEKNNRENNATGTIIKLYLNNPTTKTELDKFGRCLSNLPNDKGKFKCFYGFYDQVQHQLTPSSKIFANLKATAESLHKANKLKIASDSFDSELHNCEVEELTDKEDKEVTAKFYFAGMQGDKVKQLKPTLRGIYVRVHDRLLKHNFSEDKYIGGISKYIMFKSGLRVEFSINWLRNQISLSRDNIKFTNEKLEKEFQTLLGRMISRFIRPKLEKIERGKVKKIGSQLKQRIEVCNKRATNNKGVLIRGISAGFAFKPETDSELAILLAQEAIMKKINPNYKLIDYNDKASFDCMIFDKSRREFVYTELEPTLIEFLEHRTKDHIQLVIVWTLGKWRIGSRKSGKGGSFELIQHDNKKSGNYKLLEYPKESSKTPRYTYHIIVVEELL